MSEDILIDCLNYPPPPLPLQKKRKVYRSLKGKGKKPIKDMPPKEEVSNLWSQLWGIPVQHNEDADWMNTLKEECCQDAQQYHYEITDEVLERILKRLANDKPG